MDESLLRQGEHLARGYPPNHTGACEPAGYEVKERRVLAEELLVADEVFLTSTVGEIMPVVNIDGHLVGAGEPGPITRRLASMIPNV